MGCGLRNINGRLMMCGLVHVGIFAIHGLWFHYDTTTEHLL